MRIKKDNIELNFNQILKYLGYNNSSDLDHQTKNEIDDGLKLLFNKAQPKYVFKIFNEFELSNENIKLNSHFNIDSKDLFNHLKASESIVILAVTLGIKTDQLIKKEMLMNPSKGIILDAIASEFIEKSANEACKKIISEIQRFRNTRFSPGYGDLSLIIQEKIINELDTERKIGLYSNNSFLLTPSKSITAFFGLFDTKQSLRKTCKNCQFLENCRYRDEGVFCYDQSMG